MSEVKLLSAPTNYAVVHLSGRAFPGVVFQGDSLDSFIADLEEAAAQNDAGKRAAALDDVIERLRKIQAHYEAVLDAGGVPRPYPRR
jgi:hypothetical protein